MDGCRSNDRHLRGAVWPFIAGHLFIIGSVRFAGYDSVLRERYKI